MAGSRRVNNLLELSPQRVVWEGMKEREKRRGRKRELLVYPQNGEAWLTQHVEEEASAPYARCAKGKGGLGPRELCVRLHGDLNEACAGCQHGRHGKDCSFRSAGLPQPKPTQSQPSALPLHSLRLRVSARRQREKERRRGEGRRRCQATLIPLG